MKLTILGSGTVVPNGDRNSAGYFIEIADARLLLDCGAGTVPAMARYGLDWENLTHLFISHFHVDHCGELAALMFAFKYGRRTTRNQPLTLVAPRGIETVMAGLKQAFGENLFTPKFPFAVRVVEAGESLALSSDAQLRVAKTPHTEESLAVRVEHQGKVICYTGDTDVSDELPDFFNGADVLISECSFREHRAGVPHLAVRDVARMASAAQVKRLVVTHFYFEVDEEELQRGLQRDYAGEVVIGRDGMSFEL